MSKIIQILHLGRYDDVRIVNDNGKGPISFPKFVSKEEFRPTLRQLLNRCKSKESQLLVVRKCDQYGIAILPVGRVAKVINVK